MEVFDAVYALDSLNILANVINPNVLRRCLHENLVAFLEDADGGQHHDHREHVGADGIDDLPLGPEVNGHGGDDDADGLKEVTDEVDDGRFQVQILVKEIVSGGIVADAVVGFGGGDAIVRELG